MPHRTIPDTEIDAESPLTEGLMKAIRDNPRNVHAGDASVPYAEKIAAPEAFRTTATAANWVLTPNGSGGVQWRLITDIAGSPNMESRVASLEGRMNTAEGRLGTHDGQIADLYNRDVSLSQRDIDVGCSYLNGQPVGSTVFGYVSNGVDGFFMGPDSPPYYPNNQTLVFWWKPKGSW